jgi:RNA polymerase sigma-70 factor, ECF subfamily
VRAWASDAPAKAHSLRAYLFAIARNLYLQRLRLMRRESSMPAEPADLAPSIAAEFEARQELRSTLQRLAQFAEIDRSALLMRAFHGLSYEEIGSALGISAANARVKVHRTRQALMDGGSP